MIIRPSTVYGPFNDKTKRLVHLWILNALNGEELKIFGDENKTLDFTYIGDFIDGFLLVMNESGKEYNISSGRSVKVGYVADLIIRLANNGSKRFYPREIAQPQEINLDISELKRSGFEPKISVEEGIKKTFDWYKERFESKVKMEEFYKEKLKDILED